MAKLLTWGQWKILRPKEFYNRANNLLQLHWWLMNWEWILVTTAMGGNFFAVTVPPSASEAGWVHVTPRAGWPGSFLPGGWVSYLALFLTRSHCLICISSLNNIQINCNELHNTQHPTTSVTAWHNNTDGNRAPGSFTVAGEGPTSDQDLLLVEESTYYRLHI